MTNPVRSQRESVNSVAAPPESASWELQRFIAEFDLWAERDDRARGLELPVLLWVQSRMDDPYLDVRRDGQIDNLWYGPIVGTVSDDGYVAVGSYFIFEAQKLVRCNSFSTLGFPV